MGTALSLLSLALFVIDLALYRLLSAHRVADEIFYRVQFSAMRVLLVFALLFPASAGTAGCTTAGKCSDENCKLPDCHCRCAVPGKDKGKTPPQFVMVSWDDSVECGTTACLPPVRVCGGVGGWRGGVAVWLVGCMSFPHGTVLKRPLVYAEQPCRPRLSRQRIKEQERAGLQVLFLCSSGVRDKNALNARKYTHSHSRFAGTPTIPSWRIIIRGDTPSPATPCRTAHP
jgi:hypothetical protein